MTFNARDYARKLIEQSPQSFGFKQVMEGLPWWDLDIPDENEFVHEVLAELATAQVTVTWPQPAQCCPHCPNREGQR